MKLILESPEMLNVNGKKLACRIGRGGIAAAGEKREGDLKTPTGSFALRCVYYRPDRVATPKTGLPLIALTPEDGWCDDPAHPMYNRPVKLPFDGRHEKLWREDHVYDVIVPLGYNDGPIVPGAGSAIFMHVMRDDGVGTEGCVALGLADLLEIIERCDGESRMKIERKSFFAKILPFALYAVVLGLCISQSILVAGMEYYMNSKSVGEILYVSLWVLMLPTFLVAFILSLIRPVDWKRYALCVSLLSPIMLFLDDILSTQSMSRQVGEYVALTMMLLTSGFCGSYVGSRKLRRA